MNRDVCVFVLFFSYLFTSLPMLTSPWLILDMYRIVVVVLVIGLLSSSSFWCFSLHHPYDLILSFFIVSALVANSSTTKHHRMQNKKNRFPLWESLALFLFLLLSSAQHRSRMPYHLSLTAIVICGFFSSSSSSSFFMS